MTASHSARLQTQRDFHLAVTSNKASDVICHSLTVIVLSFLKHSTPRHHNTHSPRIVSVPHFES